jgi:hypothetical protein
MEMPAMEKHSSLLQTLINYERKKFIASPGHNCYRKNPQI